VWFVSQKSNCVHKTKKTNPMMFVGKIMSCDTQNFIWIFQKKFIWLEGGDLNFSSKEPSLSKYFLLWQEFYLDSPKTCFWSWRFLLFIWAQTKMLFT